MKINPLIKIILIISGCFLSVLSYASDQTVISLSVAESRAVFTAFGRFRGEGYKEINYRISIIKNTDGFEISFIPPLKKSDNWVGVEASGLPEVHYYLNSDGTVVLRKLLGQ